MRTIRSILAVLCALIWIVSANNCLLAASFESVPDACCESDLPDPSHDHSKPCVPGGCAPCVTLESGINPATLHPLLAPDPSWIEDRQLSELLLTLTALSMEEITYVPPRVGEPPPVWHDVVKRALPVRGPSVIA